jgi:hypothetical protein
MQLLEALSPYCQLPQPCMIRSNCSTKPCATQQPDLLVSPPEWVICKHMAGIAKQL